MIILMNVSMTNIYIDNKSRATIQNRYYIGYQAVKKIEWTALDKMEKYLL